MSETVFNPDMVDDSGSDDRLGADFPVVGCSCSACTMANGGENQADAVGSIGAALHVSTALSAQANDARQYAALTQYRNADGSWSFTGDRNVDAVLIGTKITSTNLTYTFPTDPADYGAYYDAGQSATLLPFNELQREATRKGFAMIEGYTNLTFREITPEEARSERSTFRLAQTRSSSVGSAMGNFPHTPDPEAPGAQNPSGDIWFGRTQQPYYTNPEKGNWGYVTILHEIGHTMGLKHGGDDYTLFDFQDYFGLDSSLFGTRSLEWAKDGQLWSLMTYSTAPNTRNAYNGDSQNQATSFMMYDIAALQYLYGANYNTQSGNTVYRWDPTTGENFINGVGQGRPAGNKVLETIWDGGGNDTYDLSNYDGGVSIDLRPGATSVLSQEQLANAHAYFDVEYAPMQGSVGNALLYNGDTRSLIENAIGGAGDDRLVGNQADNILLGGAGDDFFEGMSGNDTIVGGAGSDTASFSAATSGIMVALNGGTADIQVANGGDVDTLSSIENIAGTRFDDVLVGDAGDNMLAGGAGGGDVLIGRGGNDRLIGGGFELFRPDLPDVVKPRTTINNSRATAVSVDANFDLAERFGVEQAATIPHATVNATTGVAGIEYYSFTAKAGATVMLDIDATSGTTYPGLMLVNDVDRVIGSNYEYLKRDEGSRIAADPFLTAIIPADGTYYAIVVRGVQSGGTFVPQNLPAGYTYTLHISVEGAAVPEPMLVSTANALLDGGEGDDLMVTTMGDDTVIGGVGNDTVSFERAYRGITVNLADSGAQDTGAGIDRISEVENVIGTRQADRIIGTDGDNVIDGYTGQDTLIGGAGNDTLSFARQTRSISYDLATQGAMQTVRLGEQVMASGFENLIGSAFADTLAGDAGANLIEGGGGDDLLTGDSLGRIGGIDTLSGGAGRDTASFAAFEAGIEARLTGGEGDAWAGENQLAVLRGIENLEGGRGNDTLEGDGAANLLRGGAGSDLLMGMDGDDALEGGTGDDILDGGRGSDTAVFTGTVNTTVDLRITGAQDTGHGRDTLRSIENVRLGSGTNIVTGNAGANIFYDGRGNDAIDGADGFDIVDYSGATGVVTASLALATVQTTGAAGQDSLANIEGLIGGDFRNRFTGSTGNNSLIGGLGVDTLIGGAGQDTLIGGAGNDLLMGDFLTVGDLSHADRDDYLYGGDGWDVLVGGQGNDTLIGGSGNDTIFSGSNNATLTAVSFSVANGNRLDGGNDVIDGGEGIDLAYLQFGGRTDFISVDASNEQATNLIYSNGGAVGSITSIERLVFFGGNGGSNVVGTSGYDSLWGGNGNDTLIGGSGDDQLTGGAGDDYLDGGEGHDIVNFSTATNIANGITIDLRIKGPQNTGAGMDTILNVEQIVATRFSDLIVGGDENLTVIDSLGGDDIYIGNGGNDTLSVIRFASYATASTITLDGGDGEDTLNFLGGLLPDRNTVDTQLPNRDTITALGGSGNDFITIRGVKTATIDAGSGNDVVGISIAGTRDTAYDITLGEGSDELAIQWGNRDIASFNRNNIVVRDFQAGIGGDLLGLSAIVGQGLFTPAGANESLGTFSPFLSGHVTLVKQGNDTILQADRDGRLGASPMVTVMKLENTNAFAFVTGNVYAYVINAQERQVTVYYEPIITQYMAAGETRLDGHGGRDSLQGAAGNDLLVGMAGDDLLNGFAGDDTLMGGTGADYMVGGTGNDIYYVDNAGDRVIEVANEGVDLVRTSVDWTLGIHVENIEAMGGAIRATGNAGANMLIGSTGGQETLVGLAGDDTYVVRHTGTTIVEAVGGGSDRVVVAASSYTLAEGAAIEMMEAATGSDAIDLTGNEFDQMLIASAGINTLDGRGGFDIVSYRNAAAGVTVNGQTMRGTAGDALGDAYRNVEAFEGSNFADRLIAGSDGSWLYGRGGDDWLVSGAGNDNMLGGIGSDVFAFDTAGVSGRDRVLDWGTGDRLASSKQLRGADATGLVTIGTSGLLLLDGTARGDTAELVDQGGAVLRALGKSDGYWWYGYVSGADAGFDGRVTELAATGLTGAQAGMQSNVVFGATGMADESSALAHSPFYLYNAMGDTMAMGAMLSA